MKYFETLPKIIYNNPITNTPIILTNLLVRSSIINSILNNPLLFYQYDIQEGDTPEIVAHKYYGDQYRYWMVLFCNQKLDPQWDWPLNSNEFNAYLLNKYPSINIYNTVYQYQKVISQFDVNTLTTTENVAEIDQMTYYSMPESQVETYTLPTGPVTITTTRNVLSIYDYEFNLNESKRSIKLLNQKYAGELEKELQKLMSQ